MSDIIGWTLVATMWLVPIINVVGLEMLHRRHSRQMREMHRRHSVERKEEFDRLMALAERVS